VQFATFVQRSTTASSGFNATLAEHIGRAWLSSASARTVHGFGVVRQQQHTPRRAPPRQRRRPATYGLEDALPHPVERDRDLLFVNFVRPVQLLSQHRRVHPTVRGCFYHGEPQAYRRLPTPQSRRLSRRRCCCYCCRCWFCLSWCSRCKQGRTYNDPCVIFQATQPARALDPKEPQSTQQKHHRRLLRAFWRAPRGSGRGTQRHSRQSGKR